MAVAKDRREARVAGVEASWSDRRRNARQLVDVEGHVRVRQGADRGVHVLDVSFSGCRVSGGVMSAGDRVYVRLGRIGPMGAKVAWVNEGQAGLLFDRKLHPAVVDHLSRCVDAR